MLFVNQLSALLHQLGHALVAVRTTPGKVKVIVGPPFAALTIVVERLTICWSPVPTGGPRSVGICVCDLNQATPRARLVTVLAGPTITVLLIAAYVYAAFLTARSSPGLIPATFGCAAFISFVYCLWDLDPRQTEAEAASTLTRDGPQALAAYRGMLRTQAAQNSRDGER